MCTLVGKCFFVQIWLNVCGSMVVVYDIWKIRNAILHQGQIPSEERLLLRNLL